MQFTWTRGAGLAALGSVLAVQAHAQDIRQLGYNASLTAVCNVGCSSLTISLLLDGAKPTDNNGQSVPGAIAALNKSLRNATFMVFGNNPNIANVMGAPGAFTSTIDNAAANFAALVLTDPTLPLTSNALSFTIDLGQPTSVTMVTANGIGYVDPNLNYVDANGNPINAPVAGGGPYYQTGDFNTAVSLSAVPEPSSYALLATGFVGLLGVAARRRRAS
jgi:hypothetical protein